MASNPSRPLTVRFLGRLAGGVGRSRAGVTVYIGVRISYATGRLGAGVLSSLWSRRIALTGHACSYRVNSVHGSIFELFGSRFLVILDTRVTRLVNNKLLHFTSNKAVLSRSLSLLLNRSVGWETSKHSNHMTTAVAAASIKRFAKYIFSRVEPS